MAIRTPAAAIGSKRLGEVAALGEVLRAAATVPALYPLRRRWTKQPPGPSRLDYSHPMTRGLIFACYHNDGLATDLISGFVPTIQGNPAIAAGSQGWTRSFDNAADEDQLNWGPQNHPGYRSANELTAIVGFHGREVSTWSRW